MRFVDAGATVWPMIARLRGLASLPTPRPTLGDALLAAIVLLVTIGGMLTFAEAGLGTRRPDMLVYGVLGWLIVRVLFPLLTRPATRSTSTYDRYRS